MERESLQLLVLFASVLVSRLRYVYFFGPLYTANLHFCKTLGRQTSLSQFVKANLAKEEICFVEVELKGPIGKSNTIIRRTFNRTNNGTSFLLDGRTAAIGAVQARMSELNIRVNNLW
jgi:hypothetical protein